MAVIFGPVIVPMAPKKHSDITSDNVLGRSRGGYSTKIYLATDGQGLPLNIVLSGGQIHESQYAFRVLDGIGVTRKGGYLKCRGSAVIADKGYSSQSLCGELKRQGVKAIIPYKINEKAVWKKRCRVDMEQYKSHNVVERCLVF